MPLKFVLAIHELIYCAFGWMPYLGVLSMCMYQCISISAMVDQMTCKLGNLDGSTQHELDYLIRNYKMLTILCNQMNSTFSMKTLVIHILAGCQFISDVYAATHIIKLPGATFADVSFYIEDGATGGFVILRMYFYMSMLMPASRGFLNGLEMHIRHIRGNTQVVKRLRKRVRSLQVISLNVGPCQVAPAAMLIILDKMTTYFVAAALW